MSVLVFDVNETLLDLSAMDAPFAEVFGDDVGRDAWFTELLHQALVTTVAGPYVDFAELAASALEAVARRHGREVSVREQETILGAMRRLPPHEDVEPALQRLRDAAVPMTALSNGPPEVLTAQLEHAGLTGYFDHILSADTAGRLKPAPEPYRWAAEAVGRPIRELRMVAAHAWDTTGALRAGAQAAFVRRPGKHLAAVDPVPDVIGADLGAVATEILHRQSKNDV